MIEIIITILLAGVSTYFIYRAYNMAGVIADQEEYIKDLEEMSTYMYRQINNSFNEIKRIDSKGYFESDDETGTIFEQLKQVVNNLQKEFNAEEEEKK